MTDHVIRGDYVVVRAARAGDWAKAIGESLYLAALFKLKPGVLLVNAPIQAKMACNRGGIRMWTATVA